MLPAFQGVPHTKGGSGSAPWVKEHRGSWANDWWMIPAAPLCCIAHDRHSSAGKGPAGALSECWYSTQKGFWKHSEICAIFDHWKSRKRKQSLVLERYLGAQPGTAEAQGIPPVGSMCPRYPCKAGSAGSLSVPLRVSHTDTRHSDRESSVATTEVVRIPQPPRRGEGEAAGHHHLRLAAAPAPLPPQHRTPVRPTKRL